MGARTDEIDILVALASLLHQFFGSSDLRLLILPAGQIEMRAAAMDGLHEDQRDVRMRFLDALDEREKALAYHLPARIGETVENQRVHVSRLQHFGEIRLELAVAAAAQAQHLYARVAGELVRITHARAADADALSETGSEYAHAVAEGRRQRLQALARRHADLQAVELAVHRQIEHALLHGIIHVRNQGDALPFPAFLGRGELPAYSLFDIEVEATQGDAHRVGGVVLVAVGAAHGDRRRIGAEKDRHPGRAADLDILTLGETLEADRIHPVIRIRRIVEQLPRQGELRRILVYEFLGAERAQNHENERQRAYQFLHIQIV